MNDAMQIAAEHILWAQTEGHTPTDVCLSLGLRMGRRPSWDDARLAVGLAWIEIAKRPMPEAKVAA
jgi:hypothetical protein